MLEFTEYTRFLIGLLAIVDPIGVIPIFLAMTVNYALEERRKIIRMIIIAVVSILFVALLFGEILLEFFGISINSFRVGGGILLLLMAINMMQSKDDASSKGKPSAFKDHNGSIAVVPLAMPLLAGPGAISAVIIEAHRHDTVMHYAFLGMGISIITRIMGLLLAAISIEFIANGLKGLFPNLV